MLARDRLHFVETKCTLGKEVAIALASMVYTPIPE
jgi:hypothetical protein